jgi:predicted Zn-dependent protease
MDLAHRAGWPSSSMVSFYEKLAAAESADSFDRSHPPAASRVSLAKAMALLFDR